MDLARVDPESVAARMESYLRERGEWEDGEEMVACVGLLLTRLTVNGKTVRRLHRMYPLLDASDEMDPTMERGLLADALADARAERHPSFASWS